MPATGPRRCGPGRGPLAVWVGKPMLFFVCVLVPDIGAELAEVGRTRIAAQEADQLGRNALEGEFLGRDRPGSLRPSRSASGSRRAGQACRCRFGSAAGGCEQLLHQLLGNMIEQFLMVSTLPLGELQTGEMVMVPVVCPRHANIHQNRQHRNNRLCERYALRQRPEGAIRHNRP
jgi:hypothetical protein